MKISKVETFLVPLGRCRPPGRSRLQLGDPPSVGRSLPTGWWGLGRGVAPCRAAWRRLPSIAREHGADAGRGRRASTTPSSSIACCTS